MISSEAKNLLLYLNIAIVISSEARNLNKVPRFAPNDIMFFVE